MDSPHNQIEVTAQPSQDNNAMEVIAGPLDGDVTLIDLVFVHGLTGSWQKTWSSDGKSWVRDNLPKEIPHARILTCGYDARRFIQKGLSFSHASCALLQGFERERENEKRPVIFVAHSLGGLILQAFLQRCTSTLRTSIKGIMFFGTPNFGLHEKDWVEFAAAMSHIDDAFGGNSTSSIPGDRYMSQLGLISYEFRDWLPLQTFARNVICFYELSPVLGNGIIVKKEYAVLPHCDAAGLCANHIDMTKFPTESSSNYQVVMQCMRSMYCLAEDRMRVLLRHSLGPNLHGRLRNLPTTPDGCEEFIVSTKGSAEARNIGRIALVLEDQGHYKKAEENIRGAVELLIASTQCSQEARELGRFALALQGQSHDKEHEEKFGEAVKLFERQQSPEPDDVAMLFCLNELASLLCSRGQYKDAESCSRSCLSARIRISGKGSKPTLLTVNTLALIMRYQGRPHDAYYLLWDALENAEWATLDTVPHVKLLDTLARLAFECRMNDVAESLSCDVVRRSIYLYGERHPFTLTRMSNLAATLAWTGHISGAEAISRHALNGLEQTLGTDHPSCLKAARRLADYTRFQQRYDDASLRLKHVLVMQEMRIGNQHPDTLSTMRSLSAVYALQGYLKNAEVLLDRALSGQEQCFGLKHPYTLWTSKALADVKELQKKRNPVEGGVQRELLDSFAPQSRSTSETKHPRYFYTSSPFQSSIDALVLQAAVGPSKESLVNISTEKLVDATILGRALREAAAISQETSVQTLIEHGAPIDAPSAFHGTALQAASFAGNKAVVELLLKSKPGVDQEGGIFGNALRAAVLGRRTAIIGLLLDSGPTEKVSQDNLDSSMQLALRTGDVGIIDQLLEAGADINAEDNLFGSPLQQASFFGQENIMAMLLDRKADIEMRAGIFGSALQAAIQTQNQSTIAQLLGAGADVRSFHDKSENIVLDGPRSAALAKILLERLTDSLRCATPSDRVCSRDRPRSLPQSVVYWAESTVPPVSAYPRSEDLVPTPMRLDKKSKFTPISTLKRILTSKSGSN